MTSLVTEAKVTSYEVYLYMLWSLGDDIFRIFEFKESTLLYNLGSTQAFMLKSPMNIKHRNLGLIRILQTILCKQKSNFFNRNY